MATAIYVYMKTARQEEEEEEARRERINEEKSDE